MLYVSSLTVPANTADTAPASDTITTQEQTIDEVQIVYPDGCVGLVGVRIVVRGTVIAPNIGSSSYWITDNDNTVIWKEEYKLESPREIEIQAYNFDDTYEHTIEVRFIVNNYTLNRGLLAALQRVANALEAMLVGG